MEGERIKLVVDADGDGKADASSVFADGFKSLATGTAAGVAAGGGSVWFACIPDLWRFDGAKDGAAVKRTALLTGFGVHVAYGGHDMHGTKIGPDGKLYWTIADCGAHVTTREGKVIDNPDSGAGGGAPGAGCDQIASHRKIRGSRARGERQNPRANRTAAGGEA